MRSAGIETRCGRHGISPGFGQFQEKTMKFLKQLFALTVICASLTTLTACNTMHGAGKDIERGGEKMQDAAK